MARQNYTVINDTTTSPIEFGYGSKIFDVAIQYSFGYAVDVRVKYSLSWTNDQSTDNVILNFADRDNFIVDENYIYYKNLISGTNTLKIITGVDFVDVKDSTYFNEKLTINVLEVKFSKASETASDYTTGHSLYVTNSTASEGWLKAKNPTLISQDAYVIVYNYRYDLSHGVSYPTVETAYKKEKDGNDIVTFATRIGGNKYYAGIGFYIVTGASPVSIKGYCYGSWQGDNFQADNNIRFNYSSGWVNSLDDNSSYESSGFIGEGANRENKYSYYIPANSTAYITMVDSIEITTVAAFDVETAPKTKAVINLNGRIFQDAKITSAEIPTSSDYTSSTAYTKPKFSVINTSLYAGDLVNINSIATNNNPQTFYSHITLTNNTNENKNFNISYKLRYYVSNGSTSTGTGATDLNSYDWYRQVAGSDKIYTNNSTLKNSIGNLAPYSSVNIVLKYGLTKDFYNILSSQYDVWVEIVPIITESTVSGNEQAAVETKIDGNTVNFYVKNTTNKILTVSNLKGSVYSYTKTFTKIETQPSDWVSNYWQYYIDANGTTKYSSPDFNSSSCYREDSAFSVQSVNINNSITLYPNEIKYIGNTTLTNIITTTFDLQATTSSSTDDNEISMRNMDSRAYIINNSSSAYYVRFNGTYLGSDSKIITKNGWNYYIGVVQVGQILNVSVSGATTFETKDVKNNVYKTEDVWSDVQTEFENYFQ